MKKFHESARKWVGVVMRGSGELLLSATGF
jgi:hypothetical protein